MAYRDKLLLFELFNKEYNSSNCTFPYKIEETKTVSFSLMQNMDFAFNGVGIFLLTIFGVPANVLSVIVLCHPQMKSPLTTLLLGLTICDIFVIASTFFKFSLHVMLNSFRVLTYYYTHVKPYLFPWLYPITRAAQLSSIYLTVVITLERFVAVCHPLKACSLCTRSNAIKALLFVISGSIVFNIPVFFGFKTVPKLICDGQVVWYDYSKTKFRKNKYYVLYYMNIAYDVVYVFIPFTILVFFNLRIFKAIRHHSSQKSSLTSTRTNERSEEIQLAVMLLGIVITFLLCYWMDILASVADYVGLGVIPSLHPFRRFLKVLSHSSNFIFYCAFGARFRQQLIKTFGILHDDSGERNCIISTMNALFRSVCTRCHGRQHQVCHASEKQTSSEDSKGSNDTASLEIIGSLEKERERKSMDMSHVSESQVTVHSVV